MPKTKTGEEISWKEFFQRWKKGIEGITPLQQLKSQINSMVVMLIGIACGFVISLFNLKTMWWLSIILGSAFFNTTIQLLALWQRKVLLEKLDLVPLEELEFKEEMKGGEN